MFFKPKSAPDEPGINPAWQPPDDPVFAYLMQEALYGALPVWFAAVPLPRVRRFDPTFRPENTEHGPDVVAQIMAKWRAGEFAKLWIYPKGDLFIASDDYFTLAAAEKGQPDYLPCWILGPFDTKTVKDPKGPVSQTALQNMFGDLE